MRTSMDAVELSAEHKCQSIYTHHLQYLVVELIQRRAVVDPK